MTRKLFAVLVLIAVLFVAVVGGVEAGGPNGNGKGKGKAKGHDKTEQHDNNSNGGGSDKAEDAAATADDSGDSGSQGNGNTGSSKTRKGLDDDKMNQNIYQSGDTLSYHVSNMHSDTYTVIVKKPGKGGEVVYTQTVYVDADGNLNVVLTTVSEDWSGPYQVQICGADGHCKNDNINVKKKHVVNLPEPEPEDEPEPEELEPIREPEVVREPLEEDANDCVTIVYHASSMAVTVVEFFKPEHASRPWDHETERLGESRVDTEGAVMAQFATGQAFVVFEYDEATGAYNYRATGEVIGSYDEPIHVWSDGDASSVLFNALLWTPVGASR